MKKFFTPNAILLTAFVIIAAVFLSFYTYGQTKQLCQQATTCTKAAPRETQMLWDALSHSFSSISTR